MFEVITYW